jgi:hypothetical protein
MSLIQTMEAEKSDQSGARWLGPKLHRREDRPGGGTTHTFSPSGATCLISFTAAYGSHQHRCQLDLIPRGYLEYAAYLPP